MAESTISARSGNIDFDWLTPEALDEIEQNTSVHEGCIRKMRELHDMINELDTFRTLLADLSTLMDEIDELLPRVMEIKENFATRFPGLEEYVPSSEGEIVQVTAQSGQSRTQRLRNRFDVAAARWVRTQAELYENIEQYRRSTIQVNGHFRDLTDHPSPLRSNPTRPRPGQ